MHIPHTLRYGLLALVLFILALVLLEFGLRRQTQTRPAIDQPLWAKLQANHAPFSVQYIHPFYLFFYPLDPQRRQALNNETCSLSADGYRGVSPAQRGGRKLAFLVGDSVVFGFASSDTTTITGYLNQIQEEYLFVNAGVPSWNTTQALKRLVLEILPQKPDLVIGWGGYNDAAHAYQYWQTGQPFPAGTPESFDRLYNTFDDLRGPFLNPPTWYERLLPALTKRLQTRLTPIPTPQEAPEEAAKRGAQRYAQNLSVMHRAAQGHNAAFLGVFQPILSQHTHIDPALATDPRPGFTDFIGSFHNTVKTSLSATLPFVDYNQFFDAYYDKIPVFTPGQGPDLDQHVFVDLVHFYEPGNRLIAGALWNEINNHTSGRSIAQP